MLYTSKFFSLEIKFTSDIVFLTDYQSYFYCKRMLTLSRVNLTCMCGFWFIFISDMSFRFSVLRASVAALRAGKASFNILSASFFYSRALSVFSAMIFYSSSTIILASPASFRSTYNFFNRFYCSIVFF